MRAYKLTKLQILHKKHKIDIPDAVNVQKEAADIPLLFSDLVDVNFHLNNEEGKKVRGRWCLVCK